MSTKFSVSVIVPMKRTYTFEATTADQAKTAGLTTAQKDFSAEGLEQQGIKNLTPVSQQNWSIGVTPLD